PHDLRREHPALDALHDRLDQQDQSEELQASAGLEKCERECDRESQDCPEVRHDVEHAECKTDEQSELQSDGGESDREEHAHGKADEQLPAEKGLDDRNELAGEKYHVITHTGAQKRKVAAKIPRRIPPHE